MHSHWATLIACALVFVCLPVFAQDVSPLRKYSVWLPMTGYNDTDLDDAKAAGYDTVMLKAHPPLTDSGIDFSSTDAQVEKINARGMNVLMAILGWLGLGNGKFWDVEENGQKVPNQLDPFWPQAMKAMENYHGAIIDHYRPNPRVVGFAPTWGIYGEAGFVPMHAGRSEHALARFNEWLASNKLPKLDALPTRQSGPNTDFNRFIRFRYLYMEREFDAMFRRLKDRAGGVPVGAWQELYPVIGYLWNMVEVPSAEFALYESAFPFQTNHHPEKSLGETMGFRYRCSSANDYRDYYLPLLARKRGEGQRFMGCQLTEDYTVANYGWSAEKAAERGFRRWEDAFGPVLKKLLAEPLESPERDVLLVFPTYAAAALSDSPAHFADTAIIDILLRSFGCSMLRYGSPRLDKMSVQDMDRLRLIVAPNASFLTSETLEKLMKTEAAVVFTGAFARALDGELAASGSARGWRESEIEYFERAAGEVSAKGSSPLVLGLADALEKAPVKLPADESFGWKTQPGDISVLLTCAEKPLVSVKNNKIFLHGSIFAGACYNPEREPPLELAGSADASANEVDMWGPYDSAHPQNAFTLALMKNLLDFAQVDYRVPDPMPRGPCRYLGDHMEQASMSANLVYNNTGEPRTLTVRTPYPVVGLKSAPAGKRYLTEVTVPAFSYVALQPAPPQ